MGVTAKDTRLFGEAVLYRYRTGIPCRNLPERFGDFRVIHTRHTRWSKSGHQVQEVLERSKGGLTTKIHATCEALGNTTGFIAPQDRHDLEGVNVLLPWY